MYAYILTEIYDNLLSHFGAGKQIPSHPVTKWKLISFLRSRKMAPEDFGLPEEIDNTSLDIAQKIYDLVMEFENGALQ